MKKYWLALIALCCLSPAAAMADLGHGRGPNWGQGPGPGQTCDARWQNCVQAPEGGSTGVYLLGAGLTCLGAIVLRSTMMKRTQS
jgi:hypothetical protein